MNRLEQDFEKFEKKEKQNEKSSNGCGSIMTAAILTIQILFIIFKLTGIIMWGWIYVLMPIIIIVGIFLLLFGLHLLITFIEEVSANGK